MKVLVFGGAGKIGSAVAWDLAKNDEVAVVGIAGRRKGDLEKTKKWIASGKVVPHVLDVADTPNTKKLMGEYDVGVIALPDRRTSYKVVEVAIETGFNLVDILEEYHRRPDPYETEGLEMPRGMTSKQYGEWLQKKAVENGVTFLDGIGFAPGLSNLTLGEGIRKMDQAEVAVARVGGIPAKTAAQKHPLRYMITWAFGHVLREYMVRVKVIKNGKVVEVEAMSDYESFNFTKFGKDEKLECFVTPGMPSFLYTRPHLKEFAEKTVRWPGHWQAMQAFKECGLLDLSPVEFEGKKIIPRDFLSSVIEPRLKPEEGDTDVCVMWNTVEGVKNGRKARIDYYLWDEADTKNGISSMGRVTGFSAAIGAVFVGRGEIKKKGVIPPEDAIEGEVYKKFMEELRKRGINLLEEEK